MRFGPRVLETTTTTGTGSYALLGAVSGRQTFASGVGTGTLTAYFIVDSAGTSWEMGYGTLSSGPATLTRAAVLASTNSNNAVDWAAGTKYIMSVLPDAVIQSLLKNHAGSAKPAWLPTSGLWVDNSATPHILYYWDGTDSIPVAKMNATTNFAWAEGAKGADIASAGTTNLATATGSFVHVTGTTTITAFGTANAGVTRIVRFAGALTLTHNATSLILPGGANITTAANDVAVMVSEGSGNWRCVSYVKATGKPVIAPAFSDITGSATAGQLPSASDTAIGGIEIAVQSELETPASATLAVPPARMQFHPGVAKAWFCLNGTGTIAFRASHNMTSATDNGVGDYTGTIATDFSSGNYCAATTCQNTGTNNDIFANIRNGTNPTAGAIRLECENASSSNEDADFLGCAMFGDQA